MLNIDYVKADEIFEEYFQDDITPFESNLSYSDIKNILDENNIKYNDELILYLLDEIKDYKTQLEYEQVSDELKEFIDEIYNVVYERSENYPHLDKDNIGKALVRIANNYLNEF